MRFSARGLMVEMVADVPDGAGTGLAGLRLHALELEVLKSVS